MERVDSTLIVFQRLDRCVVSTQTIINHWYFNETLQAAVDERRLHHQLMPMRVDHELGFDQVMLDGLAARGHTLWQAPVDSGFTSLTAISVDESGQISAAVDPRRLGSSKEYVKW